MKYIAQWCVLSWLVWTQLVSFSQSLLPAGISPDGRVNAMAIHDGTLYVGGSFDQVGYQTGGAALLPQGGEIPNLDFPRVVGNVFAAVPDGQGGWFVGGDIDEVGTLFGNNLVHILPDHTVDGSFEHAINDRILAIAVRGDTVFVGGRFTEIDQASRSYLAAFQISTGALLPWNPSPNYWVQELAIYEDKLLVSGDFSRIAQADQPRLALLDIATGASIRLPAPRTGTVEALALQGDTLYAGGSFSTTVGYYTGASAVWSEATGLPIDTFPAINGTVEVLIPDQQGGWYLGGNFTAIGGNTQFRLAHFFSDLSLDTTFQFMVNGSVFALELQGDTLYLGGAFTQINSQAHERLAAIELNNLTVLNWHPAPNGNVKALWVEGSQVYVGGSFTQIGSILQPRLAAVDRLSGAAQHLPAPINGEVRSLIAHQGNLFVGGSFSQATGYYTGRLAQFVDGKDVPDLGGLDVNGTIYAMVSDGSGGWYIGGAFSQINGQTQRRLAHIEANGQLDPSFEFNINGVIRGLIRQGDTLFLGGSHTRIDGEAYQRLAAIKLGPDSVMTWNPAVNGIIYAMGQAGDSLYLGGAFTSVEGQTRNRLASLKMGDLSVTGWDPNANGTVYQIGVKGSLCYVGGGFSQLSGAAHQGLAAIDDATGQATIWNPKINNTVYSFAIEGDQLYAGGRFSQIDGNARQSLAAFDLIQHQLTSWEPTTDGVVWDIAVAGDTVFVGGSFNLIGNATASNLGALDKTTAAVLNWSPDLDQTVYLIYPTANRIWVGGNFQAAKSQLKPYAYGLDLQNQTITPFAPGPNNAIEDFLIEGDQLYLAGAFQALDAQPRKRLGRWDLTTDQLTSWAPEANNTVYELAKYQDTLLLGGAFTEVNGLPRSRVAGVRLHDAVLTDWQPPVSGNDVRTILTLPNYLVVGGNFNAVAAKNRNRFFAVNLAEQTLTDWAPQISGFFSPSVFSLMAHDTVVYAGGSFGTVNGETRSGFAAIGRSGELLPLTVDAHGPIYDFALSGDTLLLVGEFDSLRGIAHQFAAKLVLSLNQLQKWDLDPSWAVHKVLVNGPATLVAGEIDFLHTQPSDGLFAMDIETGALLPWNPSLSYLSGVTDLVVDSAGNQILTVGYGGGLEHIQAYDLTTGNRNTQWAYSFNGNVYDILLEPATQTLHVGGNFTEIAGNSRAYLARFDLQANLLPFSPTLDGPVLKLSLLGEQLYLAGNFKQADGQARNGFASYDGQGQLTAWDPKVSGRINGNASLVEATADRIYIAGNFEKVDTVDQRHLAAVNPTTGQLLTWNPQIDPQKLNSDLRFMLPLGGGILLGGRLEMAGANSLSGMAYVGNQSGAILQPLLFDWRKRFVTALQKAYLSTAVSDGEKLFIGGEFELVNSPSEPYRDRVFFAGLDFPIIEGNDRIDRYSPNKGDNTGDVTLTFIGTGFLPGTEVMLVGAGVDTLVGFDSATFVARGGTYLESAFSLRDQPAGFRDIVIVIPGDTTLVLKNGFEILHSATKAIPDVYAEVVFPPIIRTNAPTEFLLVYGNRSNLDAIGVPVFMVTSPNLDLLKWAVEWIPVGGNSNIPLDSIPEFVSIDSLYGDPYPGKVYALILPKIKAKSSGAIRFTVKGPADGQFTIKAWANEPMFGSPLKHVWGECTDKLLEIGVGFIPGVGCGLGAINAVLEPIVDAYVNPASVGTIEYASNYFLDWAATMADCGLTLATGGIGGPIVRAIELMLDAKDIFDVLNKCWPEPPERPNDDAGEILNSCDPNDKAGPNGNGGLGWIRTDREYTYLIRFENRPDAGLPASTVIIRDTLDPTVFDLNTFEIVSFGIADSNYFFPLKRGTFETWVDMRPKIPSEVNVTMTLNDTTGEVVWLFDTRVPGTREPNVNPLEGFLPPNTDTLSGEGFIYFRVQTYPGLLPGTPILNRASIIFDTNEPIITNTWRNTADDVIPSSRVSFLPDTIRETTFDVNWSGDDLGAGVFYYDVYVSEDGGPYSLAAFQASEATLSFTGEVGKTYAFYSVAVDSALNKEAVPTSPDAVTYIAEPLANETREGTGPSFRFVPNPNQGTFQVQSQSPHGGILQLALYDMLGQTVWVNQIALAGGEARREVQTDLAPGMYLLHYQFNGITGVKRMLIQR